MGQAFAKHVVIKGKVFMYKFFRICAVIKILSVLRNKSIQEFGECSEVHFCQYELVCSMVSAQSDEVRRPLVALQNTVKHNGSFHKHGSQKYRTWVALSFLIPMISSSLGTVNSKLVTKAAISWGR